MAPIQIDIVSDAICPWCYIGYRGLQRAISLYQKTYPGGSTDEINISWKPYFIDQVPPKESELIQDRMLRRMDPTMVNGAQTRLKRVGAGAGINFKFGGSIGSSRAAHQLLYMAGKRGSEMQCKVSEMLFHYQFEKEGDISELETLLEVGEKVGLDREDARVFLESDEGVAELEEEKALRASGINGVPHFIIGGKHHLDGAVDFADFFEAFVAAREGR